MAAPLGAGEPSPLHIHSLLGFCMAPHLICAGTRRSDKSPLQRCGEMLWLLPGAEEGRWWEVVRYACSLPGTLASGLLEEELELQSPFCPASFCCCLVNSLCMPQPASASSGSDCPRRWQPSDPSTALGPGVFAEGGWLFARRVNSTFPLPVPLVGRSLLLPTLQTVQAAPSFGICRRLGQC